MSSILDHQQNSNGTGLQVHQPVDFPYLPAEIWVEILNHATRHPTWMYTNWLPRQIAIFAFAFCNRSMWNPGHYEFTKPRRALFLRNCLELRLVCRLWREILTPVTSQWVVIFPTRAQHWPQSATIAPTQSAKITPRTFLLDLISCEERLLQSLVEHTDLSNVKSLRTNVRDMDVFKIINHLPRFSSLISIHVAFFADFTLRSSLRSIAVGAPLLEVLSMKLPLKESVDTDPPKRATAFRRVRILAIYSEREIDWLDGIAFPSLTQLSLISNSSISTPIKLEFLEKHGPQLLSLHLFPNSITTVEQRQGLWTMLAQLESFNTELTASDFDLPKPPSSHPLRHLGLTYWGILHDLKPICTRLERQLSRCPNLKSLSLPLYGKRQWEGMDREKKVHLLNVERYCRGKGITIYDENDEVVLSLKEVLAI